MNVVDLKLAEARIVKQLGYFPAFLHPALKVPDVFRSLARQTFTAYLQNPLPVVFKEKLFVYLSRYYGIEYLTICHSCNLRLLISADEILALADIAYPQTEVDVEEDLKLLGSRPQKNAQSAARIETSLLRCTSLIFFDPAAATSCVKTLQRLLGIVNYNYLIILLGYIKLCHQWLRQNPEIDHSQDFRSQQHLGSLLLSQAKLAGFLRGEDRSKRNFSNPKESAVLRLEKEEQSRAERKQSSPVVEDDTGHTPLPPEGASAKHSLSQKPLRRKQTLSNAGLDGLESDRIPWSKPISKADSGLEFQPETLNTLIAYLKNFPFPVMISNSSGKTLFVNHSWLETTGYDLAAIPTIDCWQNKIRSIGNSLTTAIATANEIEQADLMPIERYATQLQEIAVETRTALEKIIDSLGSIVAGIDYDRSQTTSSQEICVSTNKKTERFWQLHSIALVNENSDHAITIYVAKDITDIHQAQLQLRLICQTTKTTTWNWRLKDKQISLGYCGREILGLDNFDGSYSSFLNSIRPDCRESVDLMLVKTIQTKDKLNLEYPIVKPDCDTCWILLQGKLNYNSQGEVIEVAGTIRDITEAKLLSEIASAKEQQAAVDNFIQDPQRLETIFELLPNYNFVVDVNKTVNYVNQGIVRGFGLSSTASVRGKKMHQCFSTDYVRKIAWLHQQVITYGVELRVQEEVELADGVHFFETVITPIKNEADEVNALLHSSHDIPNLAATQEELSQRTIQLEAANRELESFSYSVSHDLQAPLRIINGFSQVLWESSQSKLGDRGKHYIARIQANSQKMSDLIDALLELSRVTRSQMKSVSVNLSEMAQDIVEELRTVNPQRQIEVSITPDLEVKGDPQLLRIMLSNLLHNAWKYTSKRANPKIEFNVLDEHGADLIYYIQDNGAGFDSEYVDKLFTAFQRLHTQTEFPGTGIGLATVQRIIYRHGGRVWAEGESDRGATIYFSL